MGADEASEMTPEVIPRGLPEDVKHVAHVPAARPTVAKPRVAEQGVDKEIKEVMVSRKRVVAPPDRFIGVDDTTLIQALQGLVDEATPGKAVALHSLIQGIVTHDLLQVRRKIEHNLGAFGTTSHETGAVPDEVESEFLGLEDLEQEKLEQVVAIIKACRYTILNKSEWEAANSEDFLLTLPATVNWDALDSTLLAKYWKAHPEERALVGDEYADRALIFHRGFKIAHMEGYFYDLKIDALLSFFVLQPVWAFLLRLAKMVDMERFFAAPPPGMESVGDDLDPYAASTTAAAHADFKKGRLHQNTVSIERRTLARVLKDGVSTLKAFFHKVRLQEACFEDVIVIYRKSDLTLQTSELDILVGDGMDLKRNLVIRHFSDIPLADVEMVLPEKNIYLPPTLYVQLAITALMGIFAVISNFISSDKVTSGVLSSSLILLGTRAYQIYNSALMRKTDIEKQMAKTLYERSTAAQEKVVSALVDEMIKQHTRELLICYMVLLASKTPIPVPELDRRCEEYLEEELDLKLDFTSEVALPILLEWHLIALDTEGMLSPVPLATALELLDATWDNLYDFNSPNKEGKTASGLLSMTRQMLGKPEPPTAADKAFHEVAAAHTRTKKGEDQPLPSMNQLLDEQEADDADRAQKKAGLFHRIKRKVTPGS